MEAQRTAEMVARASYGRLIALLAARNRDIAAAEDALAEAFRKALELWPGQGVPDRPEAWLLTVARRALDHATATPRCGPGRQPRSTFFMKKRGSVNPRPFPTSD
ncbi:sigma factor [Elstera litoralis]|uniref:sigma factor n=1 Tax=Elstera litoralis TaxID=552518 RepID=UPI0018DD24D9|nr:sigma factor [Elstera litoralis]